MHLMIFYGFLALFLATTLLAINQYSPIKFHHGTYFLVYELTFDVLGLLFVVGCGWALVRRVWIRPKPLTYAASDTWALGLLLAVGITGYVLEGARIANDPKLWDLWSPVGYSLSLAIGSLSAPGYVGLWWFHMGWVLTFFAILLFYLLLRFEKERPDPGGTAMRRWSLGLGVVCALLLLTKFYAVFFVAVAFVHILRRFPSPASVAEPVRKLPPAVNHSPAPPTLPRSTLSQTQGGRAGSAPPAAVRGP